MAMPSPPKQIQRIAGRTFFMKGKRIGNFMEASLAVLELFKAVMQLAC